MIKRIILAAFILVSSLGVYAQTKSNYNHYELFHPLWNYQFNSPQRAGSGAPGAAYWQNAADYKITASLDEEARRISGEVEITYKNNSPDKLNHLWLQLDQNQFNTQSRGGKTTPVSGGRFGNIGFDGGYQIGAVMIDGKPANYIVEDTRMQIRLAQPMPEKQDWLKLKFPTPLFRQKMVQTVWAFKKLKMALYLLWRNGFLVCVYTTISKVGMFYRT